MASIRKRINAKRRQTGFVPSKPWRPKPTFAELMQRMRENMHQDVRAVLPVHEAFARMRAGFVDMRMRTVFPTRAEVGADELRTLLKRPVGNLRTIAISTPSAKSDAFDQVFMMSPQTSWKIEAQSEPFIKQLTETLRKYKEQPTDKLILPPVMYDVLAKSTSQPVLSFEDGQAVTLGIDVGRGYDETAGMVVRQHPNGDIEILERFRVERSDS
jgi:hypothetical protein